MHAVQYSEIVNVHWIGIGVHDLRH
jgi:hypothetical protein